MNIRRFTKYLHEIWIWIEKIRQIVYFILVIVGVFVFIFFFGRSEPLIRLAGYFLQLSGMGMAIKGLLKLRTHFKQSSLRELFSEWLKQRPKWNKEHKKNNLEPGFHELKGKDIIVGPPIISEPELMAGERIEILEKHVEVIKTELRDITNSLDELKDDQDGIKTSVSQQTKKLEKNIRSELELLHTSELFSSVIGLIWVTLGISLSTLAPEISEWLNKI